MLWKLHFIWAYCCGPPPPPNPAPPTTSTRSLHYVAPSSEEGPIKISGRQTDVPTVHLLAPHARPNPATASLDPEQKERERERERAEWEERRRRGVGKMMRERCGVKWWWYESTNARLAFFILCYGSVVCIHYWGALQMWSGCTSNALFSERLRETPPSNTGVNMLHLYLGIIHAVNKNRLPHRPQSPPQFPLRKNEMIVILQTQNSIH